MPIPPRSLTSTELEHLADHDANLNPFFNVWEGKVPTDFAPFVHNQPASTITSGTLSINRLPVNVPNGVLGLNASGIASPAQLPAVKPVTTQHIFVVEGPVAAQIGVFRIPIYLAQTMKRVTLICPQGQGPSSGVLTVDVNLWLPPYTAGVSLWNVNQGNRPQLGSGVTVAQRVVFDTSALPDASLISVDVDGPVGGAPQNLTIAMVMEAA